MQKKKKFNRLNICWSFYGLNNYQALTTTAKVEKKKYVYATKYRCTILTA